MITRRVRQILECARLQLQAGSEIRAQEYYRKALRLDRSIRTDETIMEILGAGYRAGSESK
jgi:hypothetical protein